MTSKYRTPTTAIGFAFALVLVWNAGGCSSSDSSNPSGTGGTTAPGTGGTTTTPGTGGSTTTPGTGGTSTGAGTGGSLTTSTGGSGTTSTGGRAGGTGGAGVGGSPGLTCPSGISSGVTPCTAACGPKTCGLADLGTTNCLCPAAVYMCTSCAFTITPGGPLDPASHPNPMTCPATVADKVPCTTRGDYCSCAAGTSVGCLAGVTSASPQACLCWPLGTTQTLQWDCDKAP